jgi:hypothetical protein
MQLIVYTESTTPRLEYIFSTLLQGLGINDFIVTANQQIYLGYEGAKLNYSSSAKSKNEVWIVPVSLLFEQDIRPQTINISSWREHLVFYRSSGNDLPFDLFAASFYLLSRYEEYPPHSLDSYGRYSHENSIAYKDRFLQVPLINIWLKEFSQILLQTFPAFSLQPSAFSFLPTYDIDMGWSYLNKGWLRNTGGFIKSMLKGEWAMVRERASVLQGKQKDPFDIYKWLNELHKESPLKPLYFFLVAQSNKGYDKNNSPTNYNYQQLIKNHAADYHLGIHPSWQSGDDSKLIKQEIQTLEKISGKLIDKSRQHYIRMKLPETYRYLIEAGIKEDYSMGYGSINGFRASYCLPYKWYDLDKETVTPLVIYPFCFMEANSFFEQQSSAQEALDEMEHFYEVTKNVSGLLITIWHNHFLGSDKMFAGWKEVYQEFVRKHFYDKVFL